MATKYVTLKDSNGDTLYPQAVATNLAPGSIDAAKLADGAVTTDKIANSAITTAKVDNGAITNAKIANGAVTSGKIDFSTIGSSTLVYYSTSPYTVTTAGTYYPIKSGTITTHGGRILFTGAVIAKLTGGGIAYLDAKIDDGTNTRACQSDVNDIYNTLAGSIVFDNIPAGTHTVSYGVRISKSGATLTINGYNWFSSTFIEI